MSASCIYEGWVRHRRFVRGSAHRFRYPLFMLYLDLDELPWLFDGNRLWSHGRPNLAWVRRDDYLGDPSVPLATAVRERAAEQAGVQPSGPIRMLTHVRMFGYCFNPVTLYYCFDADDRRPRAMVAEVTNTPWGERRSYTLVADADGVVRSAHDKRLHVSPFLGMDARYRWHAPPPAGRLCVQLASDEAGRRVFDATLRLRRRALSARALNRTLVRYPPMALAVTAGIYFEAARLALKGARFHPHPARA